MANKSSEVKRIVFQPTAINREKLLFVAEKNGVSISVILNLLLDELDKKADVEIHLIKKNGLSENVTNENNN